MYKILLPWAQKFYTPLVLGGVKVSVAIFPPAEGVYKSQLPVSEQVCTLATGQGTTMTALSTSLNRAVQVWVGLELAASLLVATMASATMEAPRNSSSESSFLAHSRTNLERCTSRRMERCHGRQLACNCPLVGNVEEPPSCPNPYNLSRKCCNKYLQLQIAWKYALQLYRCTFLASKP